MELFDIVKNMTGPTSNWKKVSYHDKVRNFFMINRFMSIQYPAQANLFNKISIPSAAAIDFWRHILSLKFKTTPKWIFTKTKSSVVAKKVKWEPSKETIVKWRYFNKVSKIEYDHLVHTKMDELYEELKKLEKQLQD